MQLSPSPDTAVEEAGSQGGAVSRDYCARKVVVDALLKEGVARGDIRHELPLDTSSRSGRVDIAVLNPDYLAALEIKSSSDDARKLDAQVEKYSRYFDHVYSVIDKKIFYNVTPKAQYRCVEYSHPERCLEDEWGHPHPRLLPAVLRYRTRATSPGDMAELLWASEAEAVAKALGFKKLRPRYEVLDQLREGASLLVLRPLVVEQLRARTLGKWDLAFWAKYDAEKCV